MGVIKRQGIQNTIISYVGMVLGYINTLYLLPNFLQPDQVGLTKLLVTVSAMFAQFAALGFANMTFKFFPYYRDKEKGHQGFLFMLLLIPMGGFALVTLLFFLFKPWVLSYFFPSHRQMRPCCNSITTGSWCWPFSRCFIFCRMLI